MPNPWLTNPDRTNSTNDFSLRQMSIAYHQSLSILIPLILVKLDVVDYLVFNRRLQELPGSFLQQLLQKRLSFILCSLLERDHFTLWHWCILSFGVLE
jgi:hypothetical protein